MEHLNIRHLNSGGIITNYLCSSCCKHCLYNSSPHWPRQFLSAQTAHSIFKQIKALGCFSVHIGGGEPFLDLNCLMEVLQSACRAGVHIDYIETNSSWIKQTAADETILKEIKQQNVNTLLISISPFHNEYIPYHKVKRLIGLCEQHNIHPFLWTANFRQQLEQLDSKKTHCLAEYAQFFGPDYMQAILERYWINFGGRAIVTFKKHLAGQETAQILSRSRGCRELADTSHFHIDFQGGYIPGLCSGLRIDYLDLGHALDRKKYPLLTLLYAKGIKGLYDYAVKEFGFTAGERYLNQCDLCLSIRHDLLINHRADFYELAPRQYYENI